MACNNSKGTSVPITAAVCNRRFSSGGNLSIRAANTACTVAGTCRVDGLRQTIMARLANEHSGLYQGATLSSRKKGLPAVRAMRSCFSRRQAAAVAEQGLKNSSALSASNGSSRSCV